MILDKIRGFLGLKKKSEEKEIVISCERLERRVAFLEGGRLEEFSIERESDRQISGSIYKGKVKNLEPGLKAMFVDIGLDKNAFLHYWDAMPLALDDGVETIERNSGKQRSQKRITANDIPKIYPPGSEIIVQVTKGSIGTKGPRITTNISLAGRYLVLMPFSDQCGISRKVEDPKERQRLRRILQELELPEGMGVIIRTVGEGQKARFFVRDLHVLLEQWQRIAGDVETARAPKLLLPEPDLIERTVRDFLTDDVDRIVVDDLEAANRMKELVGVISKRSQRKIKHYTEAVPIFERFNVDKQIDSALRRQVWLPCGGYLVIDETEALVAIDVNTGRNKGGKDQDKTILQTNLEAAQEIARQLRLRNIGGLIVLDFIDMRNPRDQKQVFTFFREQVKRDKARTHILPISQLGLMEMTRQRVQESISRAVYMECPSCKGKGIIKSPETMSVEIQRALTRVMRLHPGVREVRVLLNAEVLDRLKKEDEELLIDLERKFQGRLSFRVHPKFHFEEFKLVNALTEEELS
ncbi:MAG TPA: Rne/Rng family ribonuclease [Candidatus Methylacidiphilales bacterium]|nr:Rne/Rng family ribonuclease [Candidatus Methylacidiphilales bacterium]